MVVTTLALSVSLGSVIALVLLKADSMQYGVVIENLGRRRSCSLISST